MGKTQASESIANNPDKILPRHDDGGDTLRFYPSGSTAACGGTGASRGVADNNRVNPLSYQ